jgi:hypothetical protein
MTKKMELVETNHGESKVLTTGTLKEVVKYLQDNNNLFNWVNDEIDPATGPIELPVLDDIETVEELQNELSKVDLDWWSITAKEMDID